VQVIASYVKFVTALFFCFTLFGLFAMHNRPGWVFYMSLLLLAAFVGLGSTNPERLSEWAGAGLQFTTEHFGWLYLFATSGFLLFCIGIATSDYGHIRLGAEGSARD